MLGGSLPYKELKYPIAHCISVEDIERAICGSSDAKEFIEAYGAYDTARWDKLIIWQTREDVWSGRAIFAAGAGTARKVESIDYHPRRGNGQLFQKYDAILRRFGLSKDPNDVQHVAVAKGQDPPDRVRDGHFQCQKKFGIPAGGSTYMHAISVSAHEREVPEWTLDDSKVREFIAHRFPKLSRDGLSKSSKKRVRARAGQLAAVLYLWYRALMPSEVIAEELGIDPAKVVRIAHTARHHGDLLFSASGCDCQTRQSSNRWPEIDDRIAEEACSMTV
jgi:hypothetical protein